MSTNCGNSVAQPTFVPAEQSCSDSRSISNRRQQPVVNLNPEVTKTIREIKGDGLIHLFVVGSTAGLTTIEYEPGLIKHDIPERPAASGSR